MTNSIWIVFCYFIVFVCATNSDGNASLTWCSEGSIRRNATCEPCDSAQFCRRGAAFAVARQAIVDAFGFATHDAYGLELAHSELFAFRRRRDEFVDGLNPANAFILFDGPVRQCTFTAICAFDDLTERGRVCAQRLWFSNDMSDPSFVFQTFDNFLLLAIFAVAFFGLTLLATLVVAWRKPSWLRKIDFVSQRAQTLCLRALLLTEPNRSLGFAMVVARLLCALVVRVVAL